MSTVVKFNDAILVAEAGYSCIVKIHFPAASTIKLDNASVAKVDGLAGADRRYHVVVDLSHDVSGLVGWGGVEPSAYHRGEKLDPAFCRETPTEGPVKIPNRIGLGAKGHPFRSQLKQTESCPNGDLG